MTRDAASAPAGSAERAPAEVWSGLSRRPKELSPKFFYDERGSALFDEITRLPEYYLTRVERELLRTFARRWIHALRPASLVELGAGSAEKTRVLLDTLQQGALYVPVDISATYLDEVTERLSLEYPHLEVVPAASDISSGLDIPETLPAPTVFAFLGSTIGNFDRPAAVRLLSRVRAAMTAEDRFLMGADLRKDAVVLEAAYNDAAGITAEFNINILQAVNREVGTDFDPDAFRHLAFYNREAGRIEMHLVALGPLNVTVPGHGVVHMAEGESIRTEISCKYDRPTIESMFTEAGLCLEQWVTDELQRYALVVARARE